VIATSRVRPSRFRLAGPSYNPARAPLALNLGLASSMIGWLMSAKPQLW